MYAADQPRSVTSDHLASRTTRSCLVTGAAGFIGSHITNDIAQDFDAIYTGRKSAMARMLDRVLRRDIFQRFDWVMKSAGDVPGKTVCDIGCGSGRFVTALAQRGAAKVTGVDVAPNMIQLARGLVERDGVPDRCDFVVADVKP